MTPRATAGLLVTALVRTAEGVGGGGMVLAKGDATSGAILIVLAERGRTTGLCERTLGMDGAYALTPVGPAAATDDPVALAEYVARRRRADPDLWVVEIDHADALGVARRVIG